MSQNFNADEQWLGNLLDSVGPPSRRAPLSVGGGGQRRRKALASGVVLLVVAGGVAAAILAPRYFERTPSRHTGPKVGSAAHLPYSRACPVPLPADWSAALAQAPVNTITANPSFTDVYGPPPFAVSAASGEYFASEYSAGWSGVVAYNPATGATRRVFQFPQGASDVVSGGFFTGRDLVWTEAEADGQGVLRAWNEATGRVRTLAATPLGAKGGTITVTADPEPGAPYFAWEEQIFGAGAVPPALHLYDLATGGDRTVFQGGFSTPVFWGGRLLYAVGNGSPLRLEAVSLPDGKRVSPPAGIPPIGSQSVMSAGTGYLVVTGRQATWILKSGTTRPVRVLSGQGAPNPVGTDTAGTVSGAILFWGSGFQQTYLGSQTVYVADLRSGGYARLPLSDVAVTASGNTLVVSWVPTPPSGKSAPTWNVVEIDVARLETLPGCP